MDEIRKNGGEAVPDYNDIQNGQQIVENALNTYQRVDYLINNAGIIRDKTFNKMTEEDWGEVLSTNLFNQFQITKYAWLHMVS